MMATPAAMLFLMSLVFLFLLPLLAYVRASSQEPRKESTFSTPTAHSDAHDTR